MNNSFVLYEFDFDAELFKKYYGSIDNPGIYAIPEDEVNPSDNDENNEFQKDPVQNNLNKTTNDESETDQNITDKEKLIDYLTQTPGMQPPQLNQDEQNAFNLEVEPIKKFFLINKLHQLSYLLKSKFSSNTDLDLILKFASNLSYRSLQILTINVINHLRELAQSEQQSEGSNSNEQI